MVNLKESIFDKQIPFEQRAFDVFHYQYQNVAVYKKFCDLLGRTPNSCTHLTDIPFLPVESFKNQQILDKTKDSETIFRSSGTTGQIPSQHFVADSSLYERSIMNGFEQFFSHPSDYCIIALLPSYLERNDASLVYMADYLLHASSHPYNGFFLDNYKELSSRLSELIQKGEKVILLGVTFALLDLAEQYPQDLDHIYIIETGGMKGRREEMTREQLHTTLKDSFSVQQVYSEYGMTEMLSQAYFTSENGFQPSSTLQVLIREITDPFHYLEDGKQGAINIIDLANLHSCSFIATQDIGKRNKDGSFQVLGRTDVSELRGCNLMVL